MKHVFILNPKAGIKDKHLEQEQLIKDYFKEHPGNYEIHITEYAGHAKILSEKACRENERVRLYSFGGDGTFNEIVSGCAGFDNCAVGIFPSGTGNDFAKIIKNGSSPTIEELVNGSEKTCDIMTAHNHTAVNICSTGFDGEVAKNVQKFKRFMTGNLAYTISTFYCFLTKTKYDLELDIDGVNYSGKYIFVVAANGRYYGGGFLPAPEADISDGLLDFVLIRTVSRLNILRLIGRYKDGTHTSLDIVKVIRGKKITIKSEKPLQLNIDGEVETVHEFSIEVKPGKLRLICPAKASEAAYVSSFSLSEAVNASMTVL